MAWKKSTFLDVKNFDGNYISEGGGGVVPSNIFNLVNAVLGSSTRRTHLSEVLHPASELPPQPKLTSKIFRKTKSIEIKFNN